MTATDTAKPEGGVGVATRLHKGFHGPRCWVVSAVVGSIVGVILAMLFPANYSEHELGHDGARRVRVRQIEPDGTSVERLSDHSTIPWVDASPEPAPSGVIPAAVAPPAQTQPGNAHGAAHGVTPAIPLALCAPFGLLLASIAIMPFVNRRFWHHHYPDIAIGMGAGVLAYYLGAFGSYGSHTMVHVAAEYYAFIALVGGLYVASGGVFVDIRARGRATTNTALLACGCVLANIVGTTGASVLLVRPLMRMNEGRLRPLHVVFFIFIVSNCAGCLTPIGDPPLYLGFLKGVPFEWSLLHMWPMWLMVNGCLLAMFFVYDLRIPRAGPRLVHGGRPGEFEARDRAFDPMHRTPLVIGWPALGFLALLVAAVFIDPAIRKHAPGSPLAGLPVGATVQILLAVCAYALARPSVRHANGFSFEPVKEVGFLFVGIFLTMAPALGYLEANAGKLGLTDPTQFYFISGGLSAMLDNAPTYATFLQAALGVLHLPANPGGIATFIRCSFDVIHTADGGLVRFHGQTLLEAISLGAVFFGAMTYIGNGPNFMVKSIVEAASNGKGVRMPGFFAYIMLAMLILFPVLVLNWLVWIR
jgi:Na+/H+ antiporter NhaD/arsenite permease-like protein